MNGKCIHDCLDQVLKYQFTKKNVHFSMRCKINLHGINYPSNDVKYTGKTKINFR